MSVKGGLFVLGEIEALPKFAAGARRGFLEDPESKLPRGSLELHTDVSRVTGCMSAFTGGGAARLISRSVNAACGTAARKNTSALRCDFEHRLLLTRV